MKNTFITQEFDVLLTDLQMPVMDGFTFVKRFREYEDEVLRRDDDEFISQRKCSNRNKKFLIIGMSANTEDMILEDAVTAGIDGFITKPFVYNDFWKVVKPFLNISTST